VNNMFWIFLIDGFAILALSIPLMLEKVLPNGLYGFRVPKTLSNPEIWCAANMVAGRDLALSSLAIIFVAVTSIVGGLNLNPLGVVFLNLAVLVGTLAASFIHCFKIVKKL
jgi:hypothetical protein